MNKYSVTLQDLKALGDKSLNIEFENSHDLIEMIKKTKDADWFDDKAMNAQFVLGIRLFADVMLKEAKNPLFAELLPAFKQFMKKIKST